MFDFSWSEILVIGIVALVVIGPKELPGVLRTLGQWMAKVRRMAGEFQSQFQDAIREAELADLKKEVDNMAAQATSYTDELDPVPPPRRETDTHKAQQEVESALAGTPAAEAKPAEAPAVTPPPEGEAAGAAAAAAHPEAAPVRDAAAPESVPVAPTDEPKAEAEHAGGSDRR